MSEPGTLKLDMIEYMKGMVDEFPEDLGDDTEEHVAPSDLLAAGDSPKLDKERAATFHKYVAKGLFACKRARPDIHEVIAVLSTRLKEPNEDDWRKLLHLMKFINGTVEDKLILTADNLHVLKWYVDVAFAVHPDFRSHTAAGLTMGKGFITSMSRANRN